MFPRNKKIKIENTDANYIVFGRGKKNLLIIPGVGDGFKTVKGLAIPFSWMYRKFSKDYKVYVFSRRNQLKEGFSTEDMAKDIIQHMKDLGIEKADVIGVSQGGMIAQYLGILAPDKIQKLVLVVTAPRPNKVLNDSVHYWISLCKKKDCKGILMDSNERSYVGKQLIQNRRIYPFVGSLLKNPSYDRFLIQANSCLNHNAYHELHHIKAKTFIIGAKKDKTLGYEGSIELQDKIKNSECYLYEEYSHGVYEQSKDFNDRVLDFLKK